MLNQNIMKKERYNIDDFMAQLREKGYSTPEEVSYAILESSGSLSVLPKNQCKVKYPFPLINDGEINEESLNGINKTQQWLLHELKKEGINNIEEVFLCLYQKDHLYVLKMHHN